MTDIKNPSKLNGILKIIITITFTPRRTMTDNEDGKVSV
jgi:hypothetical protein